VGVKSLGKQLSDRQREPARRLRGRTKATSALVLPGGRRTAHDLRRTSAGLGVSGDVIDECLNHIIESRVRRTYIRDRRAAEQAMAFDALGVHLGSLVSTRSTLPSRRTVKLQRNDVDVTVG
jgi:integrase